jgi:hypothetical protein
MGICDIILLSIRYIVDMANLRKTSQTITLFAGKVVGLKPVVIVENHFDLFPKTSS